MMKKYSNIDNFTKDIPDGVLASELPDEILATITDIQKVDSERGPRLQFTLHTDNKIEVTTNYNIPKSWTGRGQLDLLMKHFKELGYDKLSQVVNKTFYWRRKELPGSMKGFARHYPIKEA